MRIAWWIYTVCSVCFLLFSWGFADPNFLAASPDVVRHLLTPLVTVFDLHRGVVTGLYVFIITGLFLSYRSILANRHTMSLSAFKRWSISIGIIFVLSYPAFSFDIFNYILTARVAYHYRENPYVVSPIEIHNEPMLAYSRAINKTALYGPVWLLLSGVPYILGLGSVWLTILAFKLLNFACYLFVGWLIYRQTKSLWHTAFFAFNPLVVIEVLGNAHNDISMVALALAGAVLWRSPSQGKKALGMMTLLLSTLVKGATVVIVPVLFLPTGSKRDVIRIIYVLFGLFLLTPIREELYPWYAIWFLPFVALILYKNRLFHQFFIVLSFALLLRYIPYMYLRYYNEPVPFVRLVLTVIPLGFFAVWQLLRQIHSRRASIVQ